MPANLLYHITGKPGSWSTRPEDCTASRLRLTDREDSVTLSGPLLVNVSLAAENIIKPDAGKERISSHDVYSYDLDIAAGYTWTCRWLELVPTSHEGTGFRWSVILRPASPRPATLAQVAGDVPCDYAVANLPDTSAFFPAGCEGCPPGSTVNVPPMCGTALNSSSTVYSRNPL